MARRLYLQNETGIPGEQYKYRTAFLRELTDFATPATILNHPRLSECYIYFAYRPLHIQREYIGLFGTTRIGWYPIARAWLDRRNDVIAYETHGGPGVWRLIGSHGLPERYHLPESEQLRCVNLTEDVLQLIAHELYHMEDHLLRPGVHEPDEERNAERRAAETVRRWRRIYGEEDVWGARRAFELNPRWLR